ncbi:hypothetical protein J6590_013720 [Homalodisca vitripennis]|nr:hypothetical protein J6590_013720 [Homalodisca vitripennis]
MTIQRHSWKTHKITPPIEDLSKALLGINHLDNQTQTVKLDRRMKPLFTNSDLASLTSERCKEFVLNFFVTNFFGSLQTNMTAYLRSEVCDSITISDNGSPPLSSTTRVVVMVDDVNDNSPQFEQNFYHMVIPETRNGDSTLNQNEVESGEELGFEALLNNDSWESLDAQNITGIPLFRVLAVDRDTGANGEIHYSIKSARGKGRFGIHPQTGVVYSAYIFTAGQEFDLMVRASDSGSPNKSSTARVSVQVSAVPATSEHAPVIKSSDQRVEVTESDSVGFLVALIQASDQDGDSLWYRIVDGDPRAEFLMGGDEGSVLLARELDWETQREYNLTISVTDGVHVVYTQVEYQPIEYTWSTLR